MYLADGTHSVVAKVATPAGLGDVVPAPGRFANLDYERSVRSMTKPLREALRTVATIKLVTVWVDRTQATTAKVSLGSLVWIARRVHGRIRVVWPACVDGRAVAIDGARSASSRRATSGPRARDRGDAGLLPTAPGHAYARHVRPR